MIRTYKSTDKKQLIDLLRLNTPKYFDPSEENDFDIYLTDEVEDYFVLEQNDKILGSGGINYFPEDKIARISWDLVHPDYQGRGFGKQLAQYRIDHIKKIPEVSLIIVRTTQLVYEFYKKIGFELEKIEQNFWATGFDLYQMKLELDKPINAKI